MEDKIILIIFWTIIVLGNLAILAMILEQIAIFILVFWPLVLLPIVELLILRRILFAYWKGIFTLDSSDFPRFPLF